MVHIALIICCILSVEIFIRLKFQSIIFSLKVITSKTAKVLNSEKISDCWKEKIIPYYAITLLRYSIKSFFVLIMIICVFAISGFLFDDFIPLCFSTLGIIESIIICLIYMKIRKFALE